MVIIFLIQTVSQHAHYTTTLRLAPDNLTLKADTTPNDLTLKTYSVRLLPTL
jgi:uncharacterized membrane protein YukC